MCPIANPPPVMEPVRFHGYIDEAIQVVHNLMDPRLYGRVNNDKPRSKTNA